MPEFASVEEAEAAFGATLDATAEQVATPDPTPEATQEEPTVGTTSEEDSGFKGFDPDLLTTLPPEVQAAVKAQQASMQGDYTRKTQEAAELRKQFEGLDPELARQSVQYIQSLSNPEFLKQAHSAMATELERLGYTPAEAAAQAAQTITEQEYDDEDDPVNPRIQNELNELKQWKQQMEQERYQTYLTNEVIKQETALRTAHPDYQDTDIGHIMNLAWSTGGDLIQADKHYQSMKNYFAKSLLDQKSSTTGAIAPPATNGGFTPDATTKFANLEDAHKAAMERFKQLEAHE